MAFPTKSDGSGESRPAGWSVGRSPIRYVGGATAVASAGRRRWRDLRRHLRRVESIPSPYADPERNSVERLIIVSRTVLDPSRLSDRRYQRRIGLWPPSTSCDAAFIVASAHRGSPGASS